MNLVPLNIILKMLEDPTRSATGEYAKGYRDALRAARSELEEYLETYVSDDRASGLTRLGKKHNSFDPL